MLLTIRKRSFNDYIHILIHYGLLIMFVVCHGSWFYHYYDMKFRYAFLFISLFVFLFVPRTRERRLPILLLFALIMTSIDELIITGMGGMLPTIYNYMHFIETILITIVTFKFDETYFFERYIKIVLIMSVVSLMFYVAANINADFLIKSGMLHEVKMNRLLYTKFYCNFFYALRDKELQRNVGMFSEPGLYQILLNSAIYILLFYHERTSFKHRYLLLMIFMITLLTTQSTTGYIGLIIIITGVLLSYGNKINKNFKTIIIIIVVIGIGVLITDLCKNGIKSLIYTTVIEKLMEINSNEATSGNVRMSTIIATGKLIFRNPLGYGYSYATNHIISSSFSGIIGARILVSTAAMGILPIALLLYYFFKKAYLYRLSNVQFWVLVLLYINTSLAQARDFYPAILVLMLIRDGTKYTLCNKNSIQSVRNKAYDFITERKI